MDWLPKLRQQYAIAVRPEWLEKVLAQLHAAHPDFATWNETQVFENFFTAFLFCDLNQAGAAALPADTKEMHKVVLEGKFVLQLDEIVNMAAAARERYTNQTSHRCLKLALTDGCQQVFGVEHCQLPGITWDCPAGSKLLIHNVPIRRGLLLLGPDNTALLGGQVERLEAARQRAVAAWTRPIVGRPAHAGQRDIFGEARQAAWAPGAAAAGQQQHQQQHGGQAQAPAPAPAAPTPAVHPGPVGGAPPQQPRGPSTGYPGQQPRQGPQPQQPQQHHQPWQGPADWEPGPTAAGQHPQHPGAGGSSRTGAAAAAQTAGPLAAGAATATHGLRGQGPAAPEYQQPPQHPARQPTRQQHQALGGAAAAMATARTYGGLLAEGADGGPWLGRDHRGAGAAAPFEDGVGYEQGPVRGAVRLSGPGEDGPERRAVALTGPPGRHPPPRQGPAPGVAGLVGRAAAPTAVAPAPGEGSLVAVDLVSSSDSLASGGSSPRLSSLDSANPETSAPNHQLGREQPQQQPQTRRLGTSLLGSARTTGQAAAPPQQPLVATPPTSSSGLLPPRPEPAPRTNAFSSTISIAEPGPGRTASETAMAVCGAGSGGGGSVSRKPVLPLARSSPAHSSGPAVSAGRADAGRCLLASPSPGAAQRGLSPAPGCGTGVAVTGDNGEAASGPWRAAGGAQRGSSGRALGAERSSGEVVRPVGDAVPGASSGGARYGWRAALDVDMVDLASLDDEEGNGGGSTGGGREEVGGGDEGGGKLSRLEKRQHVSLGGAAVAGDDGVAGESLGDGGGDGGDDTLQGFEDGDGYEICDHGGNNDIGDGTTAAAAATVALGPGAGAAAGSFEATLLVHETQMEVDDREFGGLEDGGFTNSPDGPAAAAAGSTVSCYQQHHPQRPPLPLFGCHHAPAEAEQDPAGSGPRGELEPEEREGAVPRGSGEAEGPGPPAAVPPLPYPLVDGGSGSGGGNGGGGAAPGDHAGMVQLCQVPDLLSDEADAPTVYPLTADVYGLFHQLDGDTVYIEDGTAMLSAQLTDGALAPLLAAEPPAPGLPPGATGPLGLDEIQAMADSPDPAIQSFGQELAMHVMDFIKDFVGIIRLEFTGPPPSLPRIIWLCNEGDDDDVCGDGGGVGGFRSAAGPPHAASGPQGGGGSANCAMYEEYIQLLGYDPDVHMRE